MTSLHDKGHRHMGKTLKFIFIFRQAEKAIVDIFASPGMVTPFLWIQIRYSRKPRISGCHIPSFAGFQGTYWYHH